MCASQRGRESRVRQQATKEIKALQKLCKSRRLKQVMVFTLQQPHIPTEEVTRPEKKSSDCANINLCTLQYKPISSLQIHAMLYPQPSTKHCSLLTPVCFMCCALKNALKNVH